MKLRSKLLALAAAGSTAGLFAFTGVTTGAHATPSCPLVQYSSGGSQVVPGGPVYSSGAPTSGAGWVRVQGGQPGVASGWLEAGGTATNPAGTGYIAASGGSPAQSGSIVVTSGGVQQC